MRFMVRSVALAFALTFALAAPAFAEWQRIPKDQSLLVLDLPGLSGAREQFSYEQRADYTAETYYAAQVGPGSYPRGQFYLTILAPGRIWSALGDLDEAWVRAQAPFLKDKQISGVQPARGGGSEALRTVRFQVDHADCVAISFVSGGINVRTDTSAGTPQRAVRGFYCSNTRETLNDDSIRDVLSGIQIGRPGIDRVGLAPPRPGATNAAALTSAIAVATPNGTPGVPLALVWDGISSPMSGTVAFGDETKVEGTIDLSTNDLRCQGSWRRTGQAPATSREGVWTVTCNNGLGAAGKYMAAGVGRGAGQGMDSEGRPIKFTYGR
jgi:hypothetical protein